MFSDYEEWKTEALRRGYQLELDGSGKMLAHLDGSDKGVWTAYGGAGCGWFF